MKEFFSKFSQLKTEFNVDIEDIYNINKTGFQMNQNKTKYVIFNLIQGPLKATKSENIN